MARHARHVVAGQPIHITQRGNNRSQIFINAADNLLYMEMLQESSQAAECAIHAYVLMGNHVHLLLTPVKKTSAAKLMHSLGTRYARYFNNRYDRTGTLYEGRFNSVVIHSARYFFTCSRYIELNPVRALIAETPADHPWSSFQCNALGKSDTLVTQHALFRSLGGTARSRQKAYRAMFAAHLDTEMEAVVALAALHDAKSRSTLLSAKHPHLKNVVMLSRGGDRRSALFREVAGDRFTSGV